MPAYDFRTPRIFVAAALAADAEIAFDRDQANYLRNVLRLESGDAVLLFNGRDGEWRARLAVAKRALTAAVEERLRTQPAPPDLHFLFAPLKHSRLDYMVQKAVEMGVSRLRPVLTRFTQVSRVNVERMRANVIEAAQQCGVLSLPEVMEPADFGKIAEYGRLLIFCDERAEVQDPIEALRAVPRLPLSLLIGPEGGFAEEERAALLKRGQTVRIALGPRILRGDTAAVAAMALVQAVLGDWRGT